MKLLKDKNTFSLLEIKSKTLRLSNLQFNITLHWWALQLTAWSVFVLTLLLHKIWLRATATPVVIQQRWRGFVFNMEVIFISKAFFSWAGILANTVVASGSCKTGDDNVISPIFLSVSTQKRPNKYSLILLFHSSHYWTRTHSSVVLQTEKCND